VAVSHPWKICLKKLTSRAHVVDDAYNPRNSGDRDIGLWFEASWGKSEILSQKEAATGDKTKVGERLLSKWKVLSSNPSTTKNKTKQTGIMPMVSAIQEAEAVDYCLRILVLGKNMRL
jgi:hypothetical protein